MDTADRERQSQSACWNGVVGRNWVEVQPELDRLLQPLEDLLLEHALLGQDHCVLDVGCGAGSTTLALTRRLGSDGIGLGVDVSRPLIERAKARALQERLAAAFLCADAESHAFEPARFDLIVSRLGIMFFEDSVRAFANLRRACKVGAGLQALAWRSPEENLFLTAAERAAAPFLPDLPERRAGQPGPFAFADGERVAAILRKSGWHAVAVRPVDLPLRLPERDLDALQQHLGPVGQVREGLEEPLRSQVLERVRAAFDPFVDGEDLRVEAACWMITAQA